MKPPVDINDFTTWPSNVSEIVGHWAERCRGESTEYTCDLALPAEADEQLRELLTGRHLRAYHCTRLLPHEVEMIVKVGLQPLSAELISDRIRAAEDTGAISAQVAARLHTAHVYATEEQSSRENQVCFTLSNLIFQKDPSGCETLLKTWGGEGIYKSSGARSLREQLMRLGSPTVVIAHLELSESPSRLQVFPSLAKVFVGTGLRLDDAWADVTYKAPVPAEHIECILQSGDCAYDSLWSPPV